MVCVFGRGRSNGLRREWHDEVVAIEVQRARSTAPPQRRAQAGSAAT